VIKGIPLYSDMHRFIPAMSSLAGTQVAELKVNHHATEIRSLEIRDHQNLQGDHRFVGYQDHPFLRIQAAPLVWNRCGDVSRCRSVDPDRRILDVIEGNMDINFMMASGALLFFILSFFLVMVGADLRACEQNGKPSKFCPYKNAGGIMEDTGVSLKNISPRESENAVMEQFP